MLVSNSKIGNQIANTLRFLAADGVEKANSGHPGMPMGMADCAYVLWSKFLRFNPEDANWIGRDRFVLSAGHGSMLLYALLHLYGFDMSMDDLKNFRQWGSKTAGHPEYGEAPGIETTTGPLGQGFATGVGMALASKIFSVRFGRELFSRQRIYGIVSDGDLMEGVASEAASLAGHLQLGNIVYIYDDNHISIEGSTNLTFSESVSKRFESYGWQVIEIDGHNHAEIESALKTGIAEAGKPTLIKARTHIGYGAPGKVDTAGVHGAPLGAEEIRAAKENLGWPEDKSFYVPDEVRTEVKKRIAVLKEDYNKWMKEYQSAKASAPETFKALDSDWIKTQIDTLAAELNSSIPAESAATRKLSGAVMQKIAEYLPLFIGGSADLAPSTGTYLKAFDSIQANRFEGRNLHFGIREHAMGAILNGMALYGGIIPFGATFMQFADYMRPAIRLAALMGIRVIYVLTHDSIFLGEDGPTHQPVEHLASLRAIPNLTVIRPADAGEVAGAWIVALRNQTGPTALILTRQGVPVIDKGKNFGIEEVAKGGYIIEDCNKPDLILCASGSEVGLAIEVKKLLAEKGKKIRVVSMPSLELFMQQDADYRQQVLPENVPVVVIEAARLMGWGDLVRGPLLKIGVENFGKSAPAKILKEQFGFTPEAVVEKISRFI
ncbi:MAG: transketolase [Candidatus Neomarinimicrobiota bacterium]|nr:MAG: transketolase [Candidatus Neomarinimicrobiota bacterium]